MTLHKGEAVSDVSQGTAAKTGRALLALMHRHWTFPLKTAKGSVCLLESVFDKHRFSTYWLPCLRCIAQKRLSSRHKSISISHSVSSYSPIPATEQQLDRKTLEHLKERKTTKQLKVSSMNHSRRKIQSPIWETILLHLSILQHFCPLIFLLQGADSWK